MFSPSRIIISSSSLRRMPFLIGQALTKKSNAPSSLHAHHHNPLLPLLFTTTASTSTSSSPSSTSSAPVDRSTIWALWNEGNLFSLNASELASFLVQNKVEVPENAKKTALVRLVEDLMAKEN